MTIRKTISFTDQHDAWIRSRISSGDYSSDSEYVRDLIRKDQREHEKYLTLKAAIAEGFESGISARGVLEIMEDIDNKMRTHGALPTDSKG